MFKIKIEDIDEIDQLAEKLKMLTYLQGLICLDIDHKLCEQEFDSARIEATIYLWEKQCQSVSRLIEILSNSDFTKSISALD